VAAEDCVVVLITASGEEEAARIGRELVEARLAACVNIVPSIRSIYRWEGSVQDDREVLMIAKTRKELFGNLREKVKDLHSYTVPEILALPVVEGLEEYLSWVREETRQS
jgi:periplasmic divalent cation tolerance protein